jgi:hypothetical protein
MRWTADASKVKTDLRELVELLNVSTTVVLGRRELRREQGIDEGRLAQARFTCQEAENRISIC